MTSSIMDYMIRILIIMERIMGIVKISDELHDEIRKSSNVMSRSINSQAEFWIKMGMLAELNPTLTFHEIIKNQLLKENLTIAELLHE